MCRPEIDSLVRFWNEYSGEKWTGYVTELHPESNIAYLWWKETGIDKEGRTSWTSKT
jgi:hypothetical protein